MIFLESPWPILLIGLAVEAVLAICLLRTGLGRFLWAMLGVAAFTLAGLAVERLVVTEREQVEQTLDACVDAIAANDLNALLKNVAPEAKQVQSDASWVLDRFELGSVTYYNVEIAFNRLTSPPTATVRFTAFIKIHDRKGEMPYESHSRKVTVTLRKEKDRWLVADYDRGVLDGR